MVTESFSGYHGESRHVYRLAIELGKRGHDVTVLAPKGVSYWPGVRVKSFPALEGVGLMKSKIIPSYYFEVGKYEIVHSHSVGVPALFARHAENFFVTVHGPLWYSGNTRYGVLGWIYNQLVTDSTLRAANRKGCIFCISPQDHGLCLGMGLRNSHLLPVYVEIEAIREADGESFRKKYGIHGLMVLEVARFLEFKGQLRFLRDCAEKIQEKLDVAFVFAGTKSDEKYLEALRREIVARNLKNVFLLTDLTDQDLWAAYKACDVFILPSEFEGRPHVVWEAFAARKPAVVTDVGGIRESVGNLCRVVPFWKPQKFAEEIVKLLEATKLRKRMGEKAYKFVSKFSWSKVAEFVEEKYFEALKRKEVE